MSRRRLVAVAATAAAVGVASFGGYRSPAAPAAGRPADRPERPGVARGGGRRKARRDRVPPADELFDMPSDVTHRIVPTPDGGTCTSSSEARAGRWSCCTASPCAPTCGLPSSTSWPIATG